MTNLRILIVDGDLIQRMFIKRELLKRNRNIDFREAQDSESAISASSGGNFDCIILDYHLPGKSGLELAVLLKDKAPVIMMTSDMNEKLVSDAESAGINKFFCKDTATGDEIYQSIQSIISSSKANKE